jgi:hypothetical protein
MNTYERPAVIFFLSGKLELLGLDTLGLMTRANDSVIL